MTSSTSSASTKTKKTEPNAKSSGADISTSTANAKEIYAEASHASFESYYTKMCNLTIDNNPQEFQSILSIFNKQFSGLFDFQAYKQLVTAQNNSKLFTTLLKILATYKDDIDLASTIIQTIRIFSRSRIGFNPLLTLEFHTLLMQSLRSGRRKLIVQSLSLLSNTCALNAAAIQSNALKYESWKIIINFLQHNPLFKQNTKILYLCFHLLLYITAEKKSLQFIYPDDTFFKFMFDLFLERTQHFEDPEFWRRDISTSTSAAKSPTADDSKSNNNNSNSNEANDDDENNSSSNNSKTATEETNNSDSVEKSKFDTAEECKLISGILRVIFNFTMHEQLVLRYKLDKYDATYQRRVVSRAVRILILDNDIESDFSLDVDVGNRAKLEALLSVPGLISVKLSLCNVALYNADILGMNLPESGAIQIGELFAFVALQTRYNHETKKNFCPILVFLKSVCQFNGKFRYALKKYIFSEDCDRPGSSDEDSAAEDEDPNNLPMGPKLKHYDKKDISLRNLLIEHLTSIDYSVKRMTGEFLFQLCGEDTNEMIRLTGFGSCIGTLVDKGLPGFAHMGDNAVDLASLAKNKDFRESLKKETTNPTPNSVTNIRHKLQEHIQDDKAAKAKQSKSNSNSNSNSNSGTSNSSGKNKSKKAKKGKAKKKKTTQSEEKPK